MIFSNAGLTFIVPSFVLIERSYNAPVYIVAAHVPPCKCHYHIGFSSSVFFSVFTSEWRRMLFISLFKYASSHWIITLCCFIQICNVGLIRYFCFHERIIQELILNVVILIVNENNQTLFKRQLWLALTTFEDLGVFMWVREVIIYEFQEFTSYAHAYIQVIRGIVTWQFLLSTSS